MEEEITDRDLRKRVPYYIQRDVLDELGVDQVAEKSNFKISAKDKLRDAVRCVAFIWFEFIHCVRTFVLQFVWAS